MEHNEYFLSVRDLSVEYTSQKDIIHAVNSVSFDLKKGETLGLVGETGAGKTSIAKAILRVLPNPPGRITGGQIFLEGEDLMQKSEKEMLDIRGNRITMIFQDPMTALNPIMTVGDQIAEVIELHEKVSRSEALEKAKDMLQMVGILPSRHIEYPFQFSGGMKQRVVIAMALACEPDLLLADEPTTALDVTIQAQVLEMINDLKEKYRTSMIMITHDLGVVAEVCDRVAIVYAGEIIEYADKRELFKNPKHPYTLGLFGSLPSLNKHEKRLHPIPGMPPDPAALPEGCKFRERCPHASEACKGEIPYQKIAEGHLCRCIHTQGKEGAK